MESEIWGVSRDLMMIKVVMMLMTKVKKFKFVEYKLG